MQDLQIWETEDKTLAKCVSRRETKISKEIVEIST